MNSFFYFLGFEMSFYVPEFVILIFYLAIRFPAVITAFCYRAQRYDDYWYAVLAGNVIAAALLLYFKPWQYTPENLTLALLAVSGVIALVNFINWRNQLKPKSR